MNPGACTRVRNYPKEKIFLLKALYFCYWYCRFVYDSENHIYPGKTTISIRTSFIAPAFTGQSQMFTYPVLTANPILFPIILWVTCH